MIEKNYEWNWEKKKGLTKENDKYRIVWNK